MKTPEQVEKLKSDWKIEPIWDLPTSSGFEEYHDELKAFELSCKAEWREAKAFESTRLSNKARELAKELLT
jgi:hypothetical protein